VAQYGKVYASDAEYSKRLGIFEENIEIAKVLDEADEMAEYGITKFMDLSREEFREKYLLKNFTSPKIRGESYPVLPKAKAPESYPYNFDWRNSGVVTGVYDQGACGSCWAFSTTEQIESMWARAGHGLLNLAMQQLVDCDTMSNGCNGGNPPNAYQYVMEAGGIDSYGAYPYTGANGACRFNPGAVAARVTNWGYITTVDNEEDMLAWTYTYGPPSICVDATEWQYYRGGIVSTGCGNSLDHCVQITGWITSGSTAWTVRNSWGTDWGESGYIYLLYGQDTCGIGQEVTGCAV